MQGQSGIEVTNIIIAVLVPFLSVIAAQKMAQRESIKGTVTTLFIGINKRTRAYVDLLLRLNREYELQFRGPGLPFELSAARRESYLDRSGSLHRERHDIEASLEADAMLAGFVFGNNGAKLRSLINEFLAVRVKGQCTEAGVPIPVLTGDFDKAIAALTAEMQHLWNSLDDNF